MTAAQNAPVTAPRQPMIHLRDLRKTYSVRQGMFGKPKELHAVDGLSLEVPEGTTLGLVGESGCGKSTAMSMAVGLLRPDSGSVSIGGRDLYALPVAERVRLIQPVFQNPRAALNPVRRIGDLVGQPLRLHGGDDIARKAREMMDRVGLPTRLYDAYPGELSGGQRQRAAIARALILEPKVLVCDEPTSALDVSVQAQVLNLLLELKRDMQLTMIFVSHNLAVVEHVSDRVAVMYLGRKVEEAPAPALFKTPRHPYSRMLVGATLVPEPGHPLPVQPKGQPPADPFLAPMGCRFAPRCAFAQPSCAERPAPAITEPARSFWCHRPEAVTA
jgi:peptide/nickel transport system ATP-binding protein